MPQEIKIPKNDDGQRLDRFLRKRFPHMPLSMIYKALRTKKVKIFRTERKWHGKRTDILIEGDRLRLFFADADLKPSPPKSTLDVERIVGGSFFAQHFHIHFEDEYFFVAEKRAGISVHPGSKTAPGKSLIELFTAHILTQTPKAPLPKLVHRLDKQTSGLILISKNDSTLRKLTHMFREGTVKKTYLALAKGKFKKPSGVITENLLRTEGSKQTKIRVSSSQNAKQSRTEYTVQQYHPAIDASLLKVLLKTGRMHQIRVHLMSTGHPLAGDDAYGDFAWNKKLVQHYKLKRQFLHSHTLTFSHPETGKLMRFESPLPHDLKKILHSHAPVR